MGLSPFPFFSYFFFFLCTWFLFILWIYYYMACGVKGVGRFNLWDLEEKKAGEEGDGMGTCRFWKGMNGRRHDIYILMYFL